MITDWDVLLDQWYAPEPPRRLTLEDVDPDLARDIERDRDEREADRG